VRETEKERESERLTIPEQDVREKVNRQSSNRARIRKRL